jgi:hypothetical protein
LIVVTCAALLLLTPAPAPFVSTLTGPSVARADVTGPDDPVPPKVRVAVDRGLEWLRRHQQSDGSWPAGASSTTAIPSLAVMAFLARGHTPGQGRYGDLLDRAIDYVLDSQQDDGLLSRAQYGNAIMYEHGISTVMLGEVYGMVDDRRKLRIEREMARAVQLILDAQKVEKGPAFAGGWRYQRGSRDSDISVSGWQLMALRAAANCGAAVPRGALEAGVEYIRNSAVRAGGFSYQPGGQPNAARSGTGILVLELLGEKNSPEARRAGDFLIKNAPTPNNAEFYYYAVYYVCQAVNQLGGKYWDEVYPKVRDGVLALQEDDGSFAPGSFADHAPGEAYRTSMACLALCVPYRYLPLYQR